MKVYKFNGTNRAYLYEDAIDYICEISGIEFEDTIEPAKIEKQAEIKQVLLEAYFYEDEMEEEEETEFDYYFDKDFHKE